MPPAPDVYRKNVEIEVVGGRGSFCSVLSVQCNEWEEDCLSVCLSVCLFVCLSVCLSPASTLSLHLAEGAAVSNDDDAAVSLLWVETYRIDLSRRYARYVL